jgi:hypothetical protein
MSKSGWWIEPRLLDLRDCELRTAKLLNCENYERQQQRICARRKRRSELRGAVRPLRSLRLAPPPKLLGEVELRSRFDRVWGARRAPPIPGPSPINCMGEGRIRSRADAPGCHSEGGAARNPACTAHSGRRPRNLPSEPPRRPKRPGLAATVRAAGLCALPAANSFARRGPATCTWPALPRNRTVRAGGLRVVVAANSFARCRSLRTPRCDRNRSCRRPLPPPPPRRPRRIQHPPRRLPRGPCGRGR